MNTTNTPLLYSLHPLPWTASALAEIQDATGAIIDVVAVDETGSDAITDAEYEAADVMLARLWAAAPDLLQSLRDLVADLEMRSDAKIGDRKGVVDCGNGVYVRAVAVLAKAEGGQA